jgi:hypothetical protein
VIVPENRIGHRARHGGQRRLVKDNSHSFAGPLAGIRIGEYAHYESMASRPVKLDCLPALKLSIPQTDSPRAIRAAVI